MRKSILLCAVMLLALLTTAAGQKPANAPLVIHTRADAVQAMDQIQSDLAQLNASHQNYREAAEKLATLSAELSKKAEAVAVAARAVKPGQSDPSTLNQLLSATTQMQETQMSFNLQYLQFQNTMQNENRQYTMVSNIMKTKHDTVKNSISNIR
ncbi:MAG TPA: hypothetical protein VJX69_03305 [Terriglobales bacterium]|nr:hypothetical protein [Terriglobales bacterium]